MDKFYFLFSNYSIVEFRESIQLFDRYAEKYDRWFEKYDFAYRSELEAVERFVRSGKSIEIGSGTGRFAIPLGVELGVEPSRKMAEISKKRGLEVVRAIAEELPIKSATFKFALMITILCFLTDPVKALKEVKRILKKGGKIVIGMIDGNSFLGRYYKKRKGNFYSNACFRTPDEVIGWLELLKFKNIRVFQTIFSLPENIDSVQSIKEGYGEGGFVIITAEKP